MIKLCTLLAALLLPLSAIAHGPTPLKTDQSIKISAAADKVWAIVGDFGAMEKWHPAVQSTKLASNQRTLTLKEGGSIVENLQHKLDDKQELKYEMLEGVLPVSSYTARISVKDLGNGESEVRWFGRYYRKYVLNPPIPPGQDDESARKAIDGFYAQGLANLKKVAEGK